VEERRAVEDQSSDACPLCRYAMSMGGGPLAIYAMSMGGGPLAISVTESW